MANVAAFLVDRVLPAVPLRQYVLSLPYELRRLAAFKADVLTALARIFVEAVFANYRARAKRTGINDAQCGSVLAVQRFGSLNLNVHFHVLVLDGVFSRDEQRGVLFHPAPAPTLADLNGIVERTRRRTTKWLGQHGYLDEGPLEERSNELPAQTALDACATIAMRRGNVATLPRSDAPDAADDDHEQQPDKTEVAVEQDGFDLHAGVRIAAGDDMGRERLCRYAARPPISLERLRRLPGGPHRLPAEICKPRPRQTSRDERHRIHGKARGDYRAPTVPPSQIRGSARTSQRVASRRRTQAA
jgi:hypothetical protein